LDLNKQKEAKLVWCFGVSFDFVLFLVVVFLGDAK